MRLLIAAALLAGRAWSAAPEGVFDKELCARARRRELRAADLLSRERAQPGALTDSEAAALVPYAACRASVDGPAACALLKPVAGRPGGLQRACERQAALAALTREAFAGRDALEPCRRWLAASALPFEPKEPAAFCEAYARAAVSGQADCAAMASAGLLPKAAAEDCSRGLAFSRGRPADCARAGKGPGAQDECRALAGLAGGLRAGPDSAVCRASPLCQAAAQGARACDAADRVATAAVAARVSGDKRCEPGDLPASDPEIKARREREEREWSLKRGAMEKRKRLDEEEALRKADEKRAAADAAQEEKNRKAREKRETRAFEESRKKHYKKGEPMKTHPKWLEDAKKGKPVAPESLREPEAKP